MAPEINLSVFIFAVLLGASAGFPLSTLEDVPFYRNYMFLWGQDHIRSLDGGKQMQLILDKSSGAGFVSRNKYTFGFMKMRIKLIANDSAGTVTSFYLHSGGDSHDEMDFEFLGNVSGQPYVIQTNVFVDGVGNREQRLQLWFDPTQDFHDYIFLWNQHQILFYIDDVPIRVYRHLRRVPYPSTRPMAIYSTLWNGEDWATRGGLDKTDWSHAPFVATYEGFVVDACAGGLEACRKGEIKWWNQREYRTITDDTRNTIQWIKQRFVTYDYCTDSRRFRTAPRECAFN